MTSPPSATFPPPGRYRVLAAVLCAALLHPSTASAVEAARSDAAGAEPARVEAAKPDPIKPEPTKPEVKADTRPRDVKNYCANIAVAASDARIAWQTQRLTELEARLKASIQALDARSAELRALAAKRAEMEKQAGEKLVGIYSKMRPETAAAQISGLDDEMAAAVLGQLQTRQASLIFNEFAPERAAKLAALIAGVAPEKKL